MHQQNVAHLDLKPDNIFLTPAHRLHIGDFGVSVLVADQESFFEGYRGTEGWVAPELKDNPDAEYQPIRADLWASGRVVQYIAERQGAASNYLFRWLADELLSHDPLQRPLLSKMHPFYQALESKRKASVDALENEGIKRRRLQLGPQWVAQGTLDSAASAYIWKKFE